MNPNLFRMQEDPDGLRGHEERERLSKELENTYEKVKKEKQPPEVPVGYPNPYSIKVTKRVLRIHNNIYIRDECDFYDELCEKRDCLYCKEHGIPKNNIKNCIEWM